ATCITEDHVNGVIRSMGRPEDFDDTQATEATAQERLSEHQSGFSVNVKAKRLFRDENDKVIGGVCSGLANYFGIDVVIIRIIFVVLAVSFGIGFIPYLILWIAVPSTASTEIGATRKKLY